MSAGRLGGAILLLLAACEPPAPPAADAVARIGDTEVHYAEFETYLAGTVGDTGGVLGGAVLSQLFDQFLDERLLTRLAADRGLLRGGGKAAGPRRAIEALLEAGLRQEPGAAEIAGYYRVHRQEFARPERVRLRQILAENEAAAEEAQRLLARGMPFAEVARRLSRDPSAAAGGYQGELSRSDLPPAFVEVIFALQPGEVSRPVPAEYGIHIFQVVDRVPAAVMSLEQARGEILRKLRRQRADRLLGALVQEARSHYNIVVYERNLPFGYEGSYKEPHAQNHP